jgi:hypothetical protein
MVAMTEAPSLKTQLAFSLIRLFPPLLRASALEDREFRASTGLQMQANIRLNQSGVTFEREALYSAMRAILAKEADSRSINAVDKSSWVMARSDDKAGLVLTQGVQTLPLPDNECLSPDPTLRLEWFERQAKYFDIDEEAAGRWRALLAERACDDEEVEQLRTEFRLTPRWFTEVFLSGGQEQTVSTASLVPADPRYYHRLVGRAAEEGLLSYIKSTTTQHIARLISNRGLDGAALALLLSAHSAMPQELALNDFSEEEVIRLFKWLEAHGDGISQLGGIELGIAHLDVYPTVEPIITKMIQTFVNEDAGEQGRLAELAGLIVLVEGELARTSILRKHPPFWRRLASIAHASLLEREMLRRGVNISDFSTWAFPNRGQLFYLQANVDLRVEPRWLPDFLSPDQLKAEFVGRISSAAIRNASKIKSPELRALAIDKDGPLQSLIVFPFPFFPGPLEGGVEAVNPMPPEIEQELSQILKAEVVTPKSFTSLVNSALIFKIGPEMADLAAEALRRAKYQLRDMGAQSQAFALLHGLATVAAVTRSEVLASEVRILVRVVRRRPGANIGLTNSLRIAMMAAAAHSDIEKWCIFLGEWITELAYEDMERSDAIQLWNRIRELARIEPRLWGTCARADAACASISAV